MDRVVGGEAAGGREPGGETDAEEHVAEVAALPGPVEIRAEDRDDDARLGAFAQEDDECREHVAPRDPNIRCT